MADYKAFSPTAWKAFMDKFPEKTGLVVTALPTATTEMTNLVRFSLETNKWYVCDGTQWVAVSGSEGGTSDYTDLSNKPQINDVTLEGNKTAAQLGIASADTVSELEGKVTPTKLTDEDLDDIRTEGTYYANGVDTCTNKPFATSYNFVMQVYKLNETNNAVIQYYISANSLGDNRNAVYTRQLSDTSIGDWRKVVIAGDLANIEAVIPSTATSSNQLATVSDIPVTTKWAATNNAVGYRKVDITLPSVAGVVQLITKSGDVYYISKRDGTSIKFTKVVNGVGGDVVTISGYSFDTAESVLTLYLTMAAWSSIRIDVLNAWSQTGQQGASITVTVIEQSEIGGAAPTIVNVLYDETSRVPIVSRYYGSQTVSIETYNRLTIVCASRFPTCAGAWLILNNYSSSPACIELGKASNSSMSVTASVDTTDTSYAKTNIAVTVGSSSYEWDIVQIPFS